MAKKSIGYFCRPCRQGKKEKCKGGAYKNFGCATAFPRDGTLKPGVVRSGA